MNKWMKFGIIFMLLIFVVSSVHALPRKKFRWGNVKVLNSSKVLIKAKVVVAPKFFLSFKGLMCSPWVYIKPGKSYQFRLAKPNAMYVVIKYQRKVKKLIRKWRWIRIRKRIPVVIKGKLSWKYSIIRKKVRRPLYRWKIWWVTLKKVGGKKAIASCSWFKALVPYPKCFLASVRAKKAGRCLWKNRFAKYNWYVSKIKKFWHSRKIRKLHKTHEMAYKFVPRYKKVLIQVRPMRFRLQYRYKLAMFIKSYK